MPVMQPADLEAQEEEARHESIATALLTDAPEIPGVKCVRHISPLVMAALQRANNPYITAHKGFAAIGIEFDEQTGNQTTDSVAFAIAMMPKTAEVLVLLSCSNADLKRFVSNPKALEDVALDFLAESTMEQMGQATIFVTEELQLISKSRVTNAPDDEKPSASALEGDQGDGKKKR